MSDEEGARRSSKPIIVTERVLDENITPKVIQNNLDANKEISIGVKHFDCFIQTYTNVYKLVHLSRE
jgi:hypothetical protein